MAPLLLYNSPMSAPCRAALLTIRNLHLEVEVIEIHNKNDCIICDIFFTPTQLKELNLMEGEHLLEPFIEINPEHCVPTLDDNGLIIWESRAITQYLAESKQTHNNTLISNIPKEKALIQQRLYFDLGTLMPRLMAAVVSWLFLCLDRFYDFRFLFNKMPVWKDETTVVPEEPKANLYEALQMLDSMLEQNEWFVGECVTIADLSILATVSTIVVCE
jgi:glutathione S-transferase